MQYDIAVINKGFRELNPLLCGYEDCAPKHSFGPHIRDYCVLHYVCSGKGKLYNEHGEYDVKEGQFFVILPGQMTKYVADREEPWSYIWIGFNGTMVQKFTELDTYVLNYDRNTFQEMLLSRNMESTREEFLVGCLYVIYSRVFDSKEQFTGYDQRIIDYILSNFMMQIRIDKIAEMVGLDRRYMTRIFRKRTGMTVQEFLIKTRIENAEKLLKQGKSVNEAARLSGYSDAFHFSKSFKKTYGVSPQHYAKKLRE